MAKLAKAKAEQKHLQKHLIEDLHEKFLVSCRALTTSIFGWCEVAQRCIVGRVHEAKGFHDPVEYLEKFSGLQYRTVRRYLSIAEWVGALPETDQEEAKKALTALGPHKASSLAALKNAPSVNWRAEVEFAKAASPEALQGRVNQLTGKTRVNAVGSFDDRFWNWLRNHFPPGPVWDEFEEVRGLFLRIGGSESVVSFLHFMAAEVKVEWAHKAERVRRGQGNA